MIIGKWVWNWKQKNVNQIWKLVLHEQFYRHLGQHLKQMKDYIKFLTMFRVLRVIRFTSVNYCRKEEQKTSKCFEEKPVRLKIIKAWFEINLPKGKANWNWVNIQNTNTKSYDLIKCSLFQKLFGLVIGKWLNITAIHPKTIYMSKFWVQNVHWLDAKVHARFYSHSENF